MKSMILLQSLLQLLKMSYDTEKNFLKALAVNGQKIFVQLYFAKLVAFVVARSVVYSNAVETLINVRVFLEL